MTARPWFVLVESNTTGTGRLYCAAARLRGMRPVVLAQDPERYPYLRADGVEWRLVDTGDPEAIDRAVRSMGPDAVDGITSSSEYFAAAAARAAAGFGLPAANPDAVARCRHKVAQRRVLAAAGVRVPAFAEVADVAQARRDAADIGFPVVLKPVFGSGSAGVRLCRTEAEVADEVARRLATDGVDRLLLEEFLAGDEFSVEVFDGQALGVVAKHLGAEPHFVEHGHDFPAQVNEAGHGDLVEQALGAVAALGLNWAAVHVEVRFGRTGAAIVEVNPRLAGGMIPKLISLAGGPDLIDAVVAKTSGQPLPALATPVAHASIRFLVAPRSGEVDRIDGLGRAAALPGVDVATAFCRAGDTVELSHSFKDRLGYVIASGATGAFAADRAETALGMIILSVR